MAYRAITVTNPVVQAVIVCSGLTVVCLAFGIYYLRAGSVVLGVTALVGAGINVVVASKGIWMLIERVPPPLVSVLPMIVLIGVDHRVRAGRICALDNRHYHR